MSGADVGITRMLLPEASEAREFFEAPTGSDGGWWMVDGRRHQKPPQKFGQSSNGKKDNGFSEVEAF